MGNETGKDPLTRDWRDRQKEHFLNLWREERDRLQEHINKLEAQIRAEIRVHKERINQINDNIDRQNRGG